MYILDFFSLLERPKKELVAFSKNFIKAGESVTVNITLDKKAFEYYLPPINDFYVENGEYEIMVGASSQDIRLTKTPDKNAS